MVTSLRVNEGEAVTTQVKIGAGGSWANVSLSANGEVQDSDPTLATLNADDLPVALEAVAEWRNAAAAGSTEGQSLAQADANAVNVFIQEI
jgi:hypothetical protein